jgi:alpha-ketoglutarate-dependent taurine dioxygenase
MSSEISGKPRPKGFTAVTPKSVKVSRESLVRTSYLDDENRFPLVVEPNAGGLDPVAWARDNRDFVERELLAHGAVLFRRFGFSSNPQFEQFAAAVSDQLLDYRERAAPRLQVEQHIYTSTEFPADQSIPMHHEMSYSHNWPRKILFFCVQPAQQAGCTPIVDDRRLFPRIDPRIREMFLEKKVMYVRNYGKGLDLSWQEAFQTEDRGAVEAYCRSSHMEFEWRSGDRLRTRAVRQVVATHPQTGDTVWFNHAHMFHLSNLPAAIREALLTEFAEDEVPRNAFFGDGSPIPSPVLDEIRHLYDSSAVTFPWQEGDVLLLDNFLASHGREPFVGPRKILVAMADLYSNPDL